MQVQILVKENPLQSPSAREKTNTLDNTICKNTELHGIVENVTAKKKWIQQ